MKQKIQYKNTHYKFLQLFVTVIPLINDIFGYDCHTLSEFAYKNDSFHKVCFSSEIAILNAHNSRRSMAGRNRICIAIGWDGNVEFLKVPGVSLVA